MTVTRAEALDAYERVAQRFAEALRQAPPPDTPVPHMEWNVGQLGAHLVANARAYERAMREGEPVWASLDQGVSENERLLAGVHERGNGAIADAIEASVAQLRVTAESAGTESIWSGDIHLPIEAGILIAVSDALVHGWDLARAGGPRWTITADDVITGAQGIFPVVPHFLTPAGERFTGTYEIHLRGTDHRITFEFAGGTAEARLGPADTADCRMNADPAAFWLTAYGRLPVWKVALTGKVLAYGRKPWLGLRFTSLLRNP